MKVTFFYGRVKLSEVKKLKNYKDLKGTPDHTLINAYVKGNGFLSFNNQTPVLKKEEVYNKGGAVTCVIEDNGKRVIATAYCSFSDNFNYKRGRDIALGRALKRLYL